MKNIYQTIDTSFLNNILSIEDLYLHKYIVYNDINIYVKHIYKKHYQERVVYCMCGRDNDNRFIQIEFDNELEIKNNIKILK